MMTRVQTDLRKKLWRTYKEVNLYIRKRINVFERKTGSQFNIFKELLIFHTNLTAFYLFGKNAID